MRAGLRGKLVGEFHRQQAGVPFVHVKAADVLVAQRAQHAHPADAEDHLLAQSVARIAAVEVVGQSAIAVGVLLQIRVEQVDRHHMVADALDLVTPGAYPHLAFLDLHARPRREFMQAIRGRPGERLLRLRSVGGEPLAKVPSAMKEADRDHGQLQVGGGTDGVPRQHAQAAAVRGDTFLEADLHREVGDGLAGLVRIELRGSGCVIRFLGLRIARVGFDSVHLHPSLTTSVDNADHATAPVPSISMPQPRSIRWWSGKLP